jgi:hypothetical protein
VQPSFIGSCSVPEILSFLQPLHEELYTLDPERFFERTFLDAVKEGTEEAFRNILKEHSPGVFTFNMLDQTFCSMMLDEVYYFIFFPLF